MRLILIRHGAASYYERQIVAGISGCTGLTSEGEAQALRLRQRLQVSRELPEPAVLLSSPFARAMETAHIIAPVITDNIIIQDPDLEEMSAGIADGMTWSDFEEQYGYFDEKDEPDRIWAPEGESWNMFIDRVRGFLDRVRLEYADTTVVAVTHGGVIDASMRILLEISNAGAASSFVPSNTSLTEWSYQGAWKLERFDDTSHLVP